MIDINLADLEASRELMHEYGDSKFPFWGENSDGEHTMISIFNDRIVMVTYQHNDWIRNDTLYYDGTLEETFER